MGRGLTLEILLPAAACCALAIALVWRRLGPPLSCLVSILRFAVPVLYFAWFYDGTWTISDDVFYYEQSHALRAEYTLSDLVLSKEGLRALFSTNHARHAFYYWWNAFCQTLLGDTYFTPVLVNVALSMAAGSLFCQVLELSGLDRRYTRLWLLFFLCHWDAVSWTSFVNIKDPMVLFLTNVALCSTMRILVQRRVVWLLPLAASFALLSYTRFYVPVILVLATLTWLLLHGQHWMRILFAGLIALPVLYLAPQVEFSWRLGPGQVSYQAIHFLLTPQPWAVTPHYGFILVAQTLHWVFFASALLGLLFLLRRHHPPALLPLIYTAGLIALYAICFDQHAARYRLQFSMVTAWLQFHCFWFLVQTKYRPHRSHHTVSYGGASPAEEPTPVPLA